MFIDDKDLPLVVLALDTLIEHGDMKNSVEAARLLKLLTIPEQQVLSFENTVHRRLGFSPFGRNTKLTEITKEDVKLLEKSKGIKGLGKKLDLVVQHGVLKGKIKFKK